MIGAWGLLEEKCVGASYRAKATDKLLLKVNKAEEALELLYSPWHWPVCNCFHFGYIHFHSFQINDITQEQDFWDMKLAFLPLCIELALQESRQHLFDMGYVDFVWWWIYQNIINMILEIYPLFIRQLRGCKEAHMTWCNTHSDL